MNVYKIYVSQKSKEGLTVKSDKFITKATDQGDAITKVIKEAKLYGFRGRVHIDTLFIKDGDTWIYETIN